MAFTSPLEPILIAGDVPPKIGSLGLRRIVGIMKLDLTASDLIALLFKHARDDM
jgi:hypothetical protein